MQPFDPPRLLRSRHVQSVFGSIGVRRRRVRRAAQPLLRASADEVLECGEGVRLLSQHTAPKSNTERRIAVIIHGWEGSSDSTYVLSIATRLWQQGYRIIRLNLRDHGDSHHLNRDIFHSCRIDEVVGAVANIRQRYPDDPIYLCGYSLGGNFSLRVASSSRAPALKIAGVAAICPVMKPVETMAALDGGWFVYRRYFIRRWRNSLLRKQAAFPATYDFSRLERFNTLTAMTDYFVTHYTEYPDLNAYLNGYALTDDRLEHLNAPARVLLAYDDPIIPVAAHSQLFASHYLQMTHSQYGGHCGFLGDMGPHSYADDFIERAFSA